MGLWFKQFQSFGMESVLLNSFVWWWNIHVIPSVALAYFLVSIVVLLTCFAKNNTEQITQSQRITTTIQYIPKGKRVEERGRKINITKQQKKDRKTIQMNQTIQSKQNKRANVGKSFQKVKIREKFMKITQCMFTFCCFLLAGFSIQVIFENWRFFFPHPLPLCCTDFPLSVVPCYYLYAGSN